MDSPYQKTYDFKEVKEALLNNEAPFPTQMIYFFSDIGSKDLAKLKEIWPEVLLQRRRGLLEDMETMAEADTLLFFDPVAVMALEDEDPVARSTAVRLLWQSEEEKIAPLLLKLLREDPQSMVRAAAATALGIFVYQGELEEISEETYKEILDSLIQTHLGSDEVLVRRRALESLGYASHPEIPNLIQVAFDSNDEDWLQTALFAMGRSYDKQRWGKSVLRMFEHPDSVVRYEAIRAAGELEMAAAREALFDLLEEGTDDDDIFFAAIWALSKIGGKGVRNMIEANLEDTDDPEEIQLLEEALENLDFTEQVNSFDLMVVDEDDQEDWMDKEDFDLDEEDYEDDDYEDYDGFDDEE